MSQHICYVLNTDWFFLSHRVPLAAAARDAGARVTVIAPDTGNADRIRALGFDFKPIRMSRSGTNPLEDRRLLLDLAALYERLQPDLVHHFTIKPVIYGTLAAKRAGDVRVVNGITGLGHAFDPGLKRLPLRTLVTMLYRQAGKHPDMRMVFQNSIDRDEFLTRGIVDASRAALIRSSGVPLDEFPYHPNPASETPIVLLAARMLRSKGVGAFIEAAQRHRQRGGRAQWVLAGPPDRDNPSSLSQDELEQATREGAVRWLGNVSDMPSLMQRATVVTLPSQYREGVPRVLLEAAATGRPLVGTSVPGVRDIVIHGRTGLQVPTADPGALLSAVETLLADPCLRTRMGQAGRSLVEDTFSVDQVVSETLAVYDALLGRSWRTSAVVGVS